MFVCLRVHDELAVVEFVHVMITNCFDFIYSETSLLRTLWDLKFSPQYTEVSSIRRSLNTLQYYTETQKDVLIIEVSTFQRLVIEKFPCRRYVMSESWQKWGVLWFLRYAIKS